MLGRLFILHIFTTYTIHELAPTNISEVWSVRKESMDYELELSFFDYLACL